jgi:hypothetical protein
MTKKIVTLSIVMTIALVGWALAAGNPSATGHGEITLNTPGGPQSVQYSFVANELKSGVRGQAEILFGFTGERFHVDVDCLSFQSFPPLPPVATVGGIITDVQVAGTPPVPPVGVRVRFSMRDNGEGANDPPDQLSLPAFAPAGSPVVCPTTLFPLENTEGNVQVRP